MTKLSKTELGEILTTFFLANTPVSLFGGMSRCEGMRKLRKSSAADLSEYYDRITARPERSELVIALAYAVLTAILLRASDGDRVTVDGTRLLWGERIQAHAERSLIPSMVVSTSNAPPEIRSVSSPSASVGASGLLGPDGRPATLWRNG